MDCLDLAQDLLIQCEIYAVEVTLQLLQCGRTDDVARHETAAIDEAQRHLHRVQSMLAGQRYVVADHTVDL